MENNMQGVKGISENEDAGAEDLGEQGGTGSFISLDSVNNPSKLKQEMAENLLKVKNSHLQVNILALLSNIQSLVPSKFDGMVSSNLNQWYPPI